MPQKKNHKSTKKRKVSQVRSQKKGGLARPRFRMPGWAWWLGGAGMIALCFWACYYFLFSPYGLRWKAIYGDVKYPNGYDIHGIDVSHHQGKIDWELLCNSATIEDCPIRFVMIKATEGSNLVDPKFKYNFAKAHEYGFTCGAYHYFSTLSSAQDQADFYIQSVDLKTGDLPPVLDVEVKPKELSKREFKQVVLEWLRLVEAHYGVKPILYTYHRFKLDYLDDAVFDQYPYWIAHYYVDSVQYQGQWKFWQHTDAGHLPGIKGEVDFNVFNGSFAELRQLTIQKND